MDKLSRRLFLKLSGLTAGGVVVGNLAAGCGSSDSNASTAASSSGPSSDLEAFPLGEQLAPDEMRITFPGTSVVPCIARE